jgi:tRNA modification GTPase
VADQGNSFWLMTPRGEGGIAVFTVEGPGARGVLAEGLRSRKVDRLRPGELAYGRLRAADGAVLDEVIVAALPPAGGRERFELSCHAGGAAAGAAAARLAELGALETAPRAEPGLSPLEEDFRAAVAAARTARQLKSVVRAREGLAAAPEALRAAARRGGGAAALLEELAAETRRLERLLSSPRVVLAGPANAGKSTLFNRLAGADRAIASRQPGTTRDAVEVGAVLRGLSVTLTDTAGLGREAGGEVARRAEEVSAERVAAADLVLLVLDALERPSAGREALASRVLACARAAVTVLNKADLGVAADFVPPPGPAGAPRVTVSARTGLGVPDLLAAVEGALLPEPPAGGAAVFGPRGAVALEEAYTCATRPGVENESAAAEEAAGIVGSLLEAPA